MISYAGSYETWCKHDDGVIWWPSLLVPLHNSTRSQRGAWNERELWLYELSEPFASCRKPCRSEGKEKHKMAKKIKHLYWVLTRKRSNLSVSRQHTVSVHSLCWSGLLQRHLPRSFVWLTLFCFCCWRHRSFPLGRTAMRAEIHTTETLIINTFDAFCLPWKQTKVMCATAENRAFLTTWWHSPVQPHARMGLSCGAVHSGKRQRARNHLSRTIIHQPSTT